MFDSAEFLEEPPWPADDPGPEEPPDHLGPADNEGAIAHRMTRMRVDREARRRLDAEERPPAEPPMIKRLDNLLAESDVGAEYRIDQVAPANGRIVMSARKKTGKSTTVGNLIRALVDGAEFLDRFSVTSTAHNLVLLDTELGERRTRKWLREQKIRNTAAVHTVDLRGKAAALDLADVEQRAKWAARLRELGCDYLVLDCMRPVLNALDLDENHEAGKFLTPFDALLVEAGIPDALIVHHMGHTGERSRGDTYIEDWPDAIWKLVLEDPNDPRSARFFSAHGRDVDVYEGRLSFNPVTRHLAYVDGSRSDTKTEAAAVDVTAVLAEQALKAADEGLSGRRIESAMAGSEHGQKAIREAIKTLVHRGLVEVMNGPNRSKLHRISQPCGKCGYPLTAGQGNGQHLECGGIS